VRRKGREGTEVRKFDAILVATGRTPSTKGMGLEAAGIECDKDGIIVNDNLRTSNRNVYAAGDVCSGKHRFTHAAGAMGKMIVRNALFFGNEKYSKLVMPWCTYTDPEIAHVGMYARDFEAQGIEYSVYEKNFEDLDRAICEGEQGIVRVITKKGSKKIAGVSVVSNRAGELISEATVAMASSVGLDKLSNVIHPYPTHAEAIVAVGSKASLPALEGKGTKMLLGWIIWLRGVLTR